MKKWPAIVWQRALIVLLFVVVAIPALFVSAQGVKTVCYAFPGKSQNLCFAINSAAKAPSFISMAGQYGMSLIGAAPAPGSLPSPPPFQQVAGLYGYAQATASPTPGPTGTSLCIAGNIYQTAQYDQFTNDSTLNASDSTNGVALGQSQPYNTTFAWGARSNNAGTDDAYYEPQVGGGVDPFTIGSGQPLGITASHLSTPITPGGGDNTPRNWASGTLATTPFTYGYVEFQAKVPNLQGFWPAFWMVPANATYPTSSYFINGANNSGGGPEYDLHEIFGNVLGPGVVQQTDIRQYTPSYSQYVQNTVATAGSAYHTYGVWWTPSNVTFYIDRVPQTPAWLNYVTGPMSAMMTLQVFAPGAFASPPASNTSQTMYVQRYGVWQQTATPCGAVDIPTPVPAQSFEPLVVSANPLQALPLGTKSGTNIPDISGNSLNANTCPSGDLTTLGASIVNNNPANTHSLIFPGGTWNVCSTIFGPGGTTVNQPTGAITMLGWFEPLALAPSTAYSLWAYGSDTTTFAWTFGINSSDKVVCFVNNASGGVTATGATTLIAGNIYDLGCRYDGQNVQVLVNGQPDGAPVAMSGAIAGYNAGLALGARYSNLNAYPVIYGAMSEWREYGTALSNATIAQQYAVGQGATPIATPTASPTPGALSVVQYFKYATSNAAGETSSTITLGTTGTPVSIATPRAPASPDHIVLLVNMSNGSGAATARTVTTPAGCTLPNVLPSPAPNLLGLSQAEFDCPVTATPQSSFTLTFSGATIAQIYGVEVANTVGFDVVTSALLTSSTWTIGTGTGTQAGAADLGLPFYNIWDSILTASTLGGYTSMGTQGIHGSSNNNGNVNQNGSTAVAFFSNNPLTSSQVASQSITWTNGIGSENMIGEQVLMGPSGTVQPTPTPTPTATPTGGNPTLANGGLVNGYEEPASIGPYNNSGFVPWGSTSPWNTKVCNSANSQCASMTYVSNSATLVSQTFGNNSINEPVRSQEASSIVNGSSNDYAYAFYYASNSDPVVNLSCTAYCSTGNGGLPSTIHIPAAARAAGCPANSCTGYYSDGIMSILQPDGTDIDTAYLQTTINRNWQTGDTVTVGGAANCGSIYTGSGFVSGSFGGSTALGSCSPGGRLLARELLAGVINHALKIQVGCQASTGDGVTPAAAVYPAPFASASTTVCTSTSVNAGPVLGSHLWYDVPDATTNALVGVTIQPWEAAILNALHDYGAYVGDHCCENGIATNNIIYFIQSSGQESYSFNVTYPWAALTAQGWSSIQPNSQFLQPRYFGGDQNGSGNWAPNVPNFSSHLHWLPPCNAQGTC